MYEAEAPAEAPTRSSTVRGWALLNGVGASRRPDRDRLQTSPTRRVVGRPLGDGSDVAVDGAASQEGIDDELPCEISIPELASGLERPLARHDLVTVNDSVVRIAGPDRDLPWHHHDKDAVFLC